MTDYELYLVKKAYLTKRAKGVTIMGQPIMYDPYEVYNKRKREMLAAIAEPKYTHENANREAAAAIAAAKKRNLIYGAIGGTLTGGLGGAVYDNYSKPNSAMRVGKGTIGGAVGGLGVGLTTAAINNAVGNFDKAKYKGYDKGDAMDREIYRKARQKYEDDVAKATREFNLKYTGMEDPTRDAIYKGGIKLHDE